MALKKTVEPPRRQTRQEKQKRLEVFALDINPFTSNLGALGVLAVRKPFLK